MASKTAHSLKCFTFSAPLLQMKQNKNIKITLILKEKEKQKENITSCKFGYQLEKIEWNKER